MDDQNQNPQPGGAPADQGGQPMGWTPPAPQPAEPSAPAEAPGAPADQGGQWNPEPTTPPAQGGDTPAPAADPNGGQAPAAGGWDQGNQGGQPAQ